MKLYAPIEETIESFLHKPLSEDRKKVLEPLVLYLQKKVDAHQPIRLHFICTHNSRRSHMSQVWGQTLAYYFKVANVVCSSGGTQTTAIHPMVIEVFKDAGFKIKKISQERNAVHCIKFAKNELPVISFSKTITHEINPESEFGAVMTCSEADACPYVPGAEERFPVIYEDPKIFDADPLQKVKYRERSLQIAGELAYVFNSLKFSL